MTVKELIKQLKQYDPNMQVVVNGQEEGYDDLFIAEQEIYLDPSPYGGNYSCWTIWEEENENKNTKHWKAVVLERH